MPCWARRVVSVAPIIANVNPEEMPRNRAASGAGSRYGLNPSGNLPRKPLSQGVVIFDRQGRMVREALRLVDRHAPRGRRELRRGDLVVDAPAHILRVRLPAVAPPRVALRRRVGAQPSIDGYPTPLVDHPTLP